MIQIEFKKFSCFSINSKNLESDCNPKETKRDSLECAPCRKSIDVGSIL